jgi:hypothetical protein
MKPSRLTHLAISTKAEVVMFFSLSWTTVAPPATAAATTLRRIENAEISLSLGYEQHSLDDDVMCHQFKIIQQHN